jgi:hypothetical protein
MDPETKFRMTIGNDPPFCHSREGGNPSPLRSVGWHPPELDSRLRGNDSYIWWRRWRSSKDVGRLIWLIFNIIILSFCGEKMSKRWGFILYLLPISQPTFASDQLFFPPHVVSRFSSADKCEENLKRKAKKAASDGNAFLQGGELLIHRFSSSGLRVKIFWCDGSQQWFRRMLVISTRLRPSSVRLSMPPPPTSLSPPPSPVPATTAAPR